MGWRRRHGNPDGNQEEIVKLVRRIGASYQITTGVGGGFPDGVVGIRGITVLVELKRPERFVSGERKALVLRESQQQFIRTWNGGPVLAVDDGMDLVQKLVHLDRVTPPVRGATDRFEAGTAQAILADCLDAAGGLVTDADDLPALIRRLMGEDATNAKNRVG